ncbi:hypothetical protein [Chlorobium phaeovibrioides]|uniref:CPBP family intramembrane metalloprotease n=1 Tax=Chlorobium phaeovibrioides TaxID=1094 RepID=A0A3S0L3A3_CHLPH|nr:hypothetical protein [Chlorobium phaeovibrioides]QEQ57038.1 hypothetical protein FNV82_05120 [Chlorobium phaeovibrioides]RTY40008.1 hypothetical protein EKD02_01020 [Chlorobium phaeovibrioides]
MEFTVPVMVYTYWLIAVGIGLAFFRKDIFSFNTDFATRRIILLVASLLIVALNAWVYSNSTYSSGRPLDILTLLVFSVGNGIAETFMFYAVFRLGTVLAGKATDNPWVLFTAGFLLFMIYSGLIHGLFWINILPEHVDQASAFKPFFMPVQILIAGSWALSFFWYRDIRSVILLHAMIDFTMAWNVRFSLFN